MNKYDFKILRLLIIYQLVGFIITITGVLLSKLYGGNYLYRLSFLAPFAVALGCGFILTVCFFGIRSIGQSHNKTDIRSQFAYVLFTFAKWILLPAAILTAIFIALMKYVAHTI